MNHPTGCDPKKITTKDDGIQPPDNLANSTKVKIFDDLTSEIIEAYGHKELMVSISKDMKLRRTKQQLVKTHMNSVFRNPEVRKVLLLHECFDKRGIGKVLKAVLAAIVHVAKTQGREDLLEYSPEASVDLLDNKLIATDMTPGLVGNLVAGRPEFCSDKGIGQKLPQQRWEYLVAQSKMPLVIGREALTVLAQINRLPEGYLKDREVIDDADLAEVTESQVEPISHRHHLNQVINLVRTALSKDVYKLYDLFKLDGTGRIHGVSRTSHQGPGGIRCLHTAPTRESVSLEDMRLFAWKLQDEFGINYADIDSYLANRCERLIKEGISLNALGAMNEFKRAARTQRTNFLFEGDMNLSLGTIKALVTGCLDSLAELGMLGGRKNTWLTIAKKVGARCSWMKHLANNLWRNITKKPGTPGGYGASANTMGVAVLGLTGVRIDKRPITCLDDLYVSLVDENGQAIPLELRDCIKIELILPSIREARPAVLEAITKQAARDFPGADLTTGMLIDYAEDMAEEVLIAMNEVLPCLAVFDKLVLPPAKRKQKAKADRNITGPLGFVALIPELKLSTDKKDTKRVGVLYNLRKRTMKYIKAYFNKSNLGVGPYLVFLIESASLVMLWMQTRSWCTYQKAIHDALLIRLQDVRRMNKAHTLSLCDAVAKLDMTQFDLVSSKGEVLVDLEAREAVLDRVREEGNAWGLPSTGELKAQFPELEAHLNSVNPNLWQVAVPKEKSIVLYNDTTVA
jgi:hypothetical protein